MKRYLISLILILLASCAPPAPMKVVELEKVPVPVRETVIMKEINAMRSRKDYKGIIAFYESRKDTFASKDSLRYICEAYFIEKDYRNAITVGEAIFKKFPQYIDGGLNLIMGVCYVKIDMFEAARRNLEKARDLGVQSDRITVHLVEIYMKKGQLALAFGMAKELDGRKRDYVHGIIYMKEDNYKKALEKFEGLQDFEDAPFLRLFCLMKLGRDEDILTLTGSGAFRKYPGMPVILAGAYLRKGQPWKARDVLEEAIAEGKKQPVIWRNLGLVYELYLGDPKKAKQCYAEYLKQVKDDETKKWHDAL